MRRKTRAVKAGNVIIGAGFPISLQTMWKTRLAPETLADVARSLESLQEIGCDLVRFAVPDIENADLLGELSRLSPMPLVADIHFDYRIAMRCLDHPIAKIRINPGNIGEEWKVKEVVSKAAGKGVCLRIGINAGSLPRTLQGEKDVAEAMVKAAEIEMEVLDRQGFKDAVFSMKSSDVLQTLRANTLFSGKHDYPLHIGITEAGPLIPGIVKNTIGISNLITAGIGDTIRVSLSATPEDEVITGREILRTLKERSKGIEIISCPRCGRTTFDVKVFLEQVSSFIQKVQEPLTIAVMGCAVNGPGEAKRADLGITGAGKMAIIFKGGAILRRVPFEEAVSSFKEEIEKLCGQARL